MFNIGPTELIVVLIIALIVFGPKRLPEIGRTVGKSLREFRRASEGLREELHLGLDDDERSGSAPAASTNGAEQAAPPPPLPGSPGAGSHPDQPGSTQAAS